MKTLKIAALASALGLAPPMGLAQNMASDLTDIVRFELLEGWRQSDGTHMVAVRVHLKEGWNTYWRVGGNSGIPPRVTFEGSSNVQSAEIQWPRPVAFDLHDSLVIGYLDELVLPVVVTPKAVGADIRLQATLDLGVCSEICIPVTAEFEAVLPANATTRDGDIHAALATIPSASVAGNTATANCQLKPVKDGFHLRAEVVVPKFTEGEEIGVVEFPNPNIWIALPKIKRLGDTLVMDVDMINYAGGDFNPDPADIRITVLGKDQALDIQGCALTSG